jgi:hypothetical protein
MPTRNKLRQQIPRTRSRRAGATDGEDIFAPKSRLSSTYLLALIYEDVLNFCKSVSERTEAGESLPAAG